MSDISLSGSHRGVTLVSNRFIDELMTDANESQVKIYLYLLRCMESGMPVSVCSLADRFNYTEKDVLRALIYWEKKGLLTIHYDSDKNLVGICLNELPMAAPAANVPVSAASAAAPATAVPAGSANVSVTAASASVPAASSAAEGDGATVPFYTQEQMSAFQGREDIQQLIFTTELYMGKPLSRSDINSLLFMHQDLRFPVDLLDYLVEYCINAGHKSMRYIETVGRSWADRGIRTLQEAKAGTGPNRYYKECYAILKELGITERGPVPSDIEFITRWIEEMGFSLDLILEACRRTILSISKPSFHYVDSILVRWNREGIFSKKALQEADEAHKKAQTAAPCAAGQASGTPNRFHNFSERDTDYDALAKELFANYEFIKPANE